MKVAKWIGAGLLAAIVGALFFLLLAAPVFAMEYHRAHAMTSIMCVDLDEKHEMLVDILGPAERKMEGTTAGLSRPIEVWQSVGGEDFLVVVDVVANEDTGPRLACIAQGTIFPKKAQGGVTT